MIVIGVMGGGKADDAVLRMAYDLGKAVARQGWVLLNGGRPAGVMEMSAQGAKQAGGLTVGVLPGENKKAAGAYIDIAVTTGMGNARNVINVLSSDVVVALPGGLGTVSEVALALKAGRPVIVLGWDPGDAIREAAKGRLYHAGTVDEVIALAKTL